MSHPPTGTLTCLFTDIEGSSRLWEQHPDAMRVALARHDAIVREAIETHGGHVFKTIGDQFCAVFISAPDAVWAALAAQRGLRDEAWGEIGPLRARMALHTGNAVERDGDYFGPPLNRVDRLLRIGHGGQVLMSLATRELARESLPEGTLLLDLGEHRLRGMSRPERIFQLNAEDLPSTFPPLRTQEAELARQRIPMPPTSFIGRKAELAMVSALLDRSDVRLVTLTGPGGTGKTRLALQVAANVAGEFEHGVCYVTLSPVRDKALAISAIAQAIGIKEVPGQPLVESIKEHLRERELLLVLDNFEQVIQAAPLVSDLLLAARRLKVLVTSREVLRVYGEHEYVVPPLTLPDMKRLPRLERLRECAALELFVERAQAIKGGFQLTPENVRAVAEICVRLDGLPLAIELAAARIRLFSPHEMLARLQNRFTLLTGGGRDLPTRQRTLRNAIDWSYDLLEPHERRLFGRLAVFAGGCAVEAAEAVCNTGGELDVDILSGLTSLLEKSLLQQRDGPGDESRFAMLGTIQEYALERLTENDQIQIIQRRHADYFLSLAEQAQADLTGARQVEWLNRLEGEHDNLRAALQWSLHAGPADTALRIGGALWRFWQMRGYLSEGRGWLEMALAAGQGCAAAPSPFCVQALHGAGVLAYEQGDIDRAQVYFQDCLALRRGLDDKRGMAAMLNNIANIAIIRGDYPRATSIYEESRALWQEIGDKWGLATCLNNLGLLAYYQSDYACARAFHEQSLSLSRELGDKRNAAISLNSLGDVAREQNDFDRAQAFYTESMTFWRALGEKRGLASSLSNLGLLAFTRNEYAQAVNHYRQGLALCQQVNEQNGISMCLDRIAQALAAQGQAARAAQLMGATQAIREAASIVLAHEFRQEREAMIEMVRAQLDAPTFTAAWNQGRGMTVEQAAAYAMEEQGK